MNFHDSRPVANDFKIRFALEETPYWGAYMTDVFVGLHQTDSSWVKSWIKRDPVGVDEQIARLERELADIGAVDPLLVAFGGVAYDVLRCCLGKKYRIVKVTHYAHQVGKEKYRDEVLRVLDGVTKRDSRVGYERGAPGVSWDDRPVAVSGRERARSWRSTRRHTVQRGSGAYGADTQSEADLEREFIGSCSRRRTSTCRSRPRRSWSPTCATQLEALNGITFSDAEWERFFAERIAGANDGIVEKTVRIQEDHVQLLKRDDGSTKNITLIDKTNIHNNRLQVINQYEIGQGEGGAARQPLRRDGPRQRPADGAHRAQAPRRRHPRGVQPDRPLPARQLLGRLRAVRVRPALRDQQRHADEVLLQHHPPPAPQRDDGREARRGRPRTRSSSPRGGPTPRTSRSRT